MKTLTVRLPGREYEIKIQRGLLDRTGAELRAVSRGGRAAVVTDSNVSPLYGARVLASLEAAGFQTRLVTVPAGERSKTVSELEYLYDQLMDFCLTRSDLVVALGGGVVGDLAGFAAATILRGVDFVQIPTTLLAQVDSSVGGKVAVDLKAGKNLAGAFHQPVLVLIDPDVLDTLPARELSCGMAEVIKYGAIRDRALFGQLEELDPERELRPALEEIIYRCCDSKRELVERDERDTGERMLLNFGHTMGHAYEKAGGYEKYNHGEAVAAGMCAAAGLGERLGVTPAGTEARLRASVRKFGLPEEISCGIEELKAALSLDKKGAGSRIRLVLLRAPGDAALYPMEKDRLLELLKEGAE